MAVPYSGFKVLANMYTKNLWQTEWERYPEIKLYKIQPKVDDPIPSHGRCHREETIMQIAYWSHFLNKFLLIERWGTACMHALWWVVFCWAHAHRVFRLDGVEKAIF